MPIAKAADCGLKKGGKARLRDWQGGGLQTWPWPGRSPREAGWKHQAVRSAGRWADWVWAGPHHEKVFLVDVDVVGCRLAAIVVIPCAALVH